MIGPGSDKNVLGCGDVSVLRFQICVDCNVEMCEVLR